LEQYFGRDTDQPQRRKRFLLYGLGGTGKSQNFLSETLTGEFQLDSYSTSAHLAMSLPRFWRIFWIDATSIDTMKLSFRDITNEPEAKACGVDESAESAVSLLSRIKDEWLLVFDNADGAPEMIAKLIPPGDRGNILLTSRNPDMRRNAPEASAEIDRMEEADGISLLLKAAFLDGSSEELAQATLIVTELYFLPLAVDQAAACIASGLCNIGGYLPMYSKHRQKLLADPFFEGASDYGRAVYGTWDLSFRTIEAMTNIASDFSSSRECHFDSSIIRLLPSRQHSRRNL
jgi:hypothetical protein